MTLPRQTAATPDLDRAQTRRGVLFILAAMFAISVNDATIKALSGDYPLHQMIFVRSAIALVFSFVFLRLEGGLALLRTRMPGLHALRALLIVFANMAFFAGLAVLPLADATALFFVAPLLITLLSIPVLGEPVGPRRLAALVAGFAGVLVMASADRAAPATDGSPAWAFALPIVAATAYAGMQVLTRKLGVSTRASAMAIYIQLAFLLVAALFFLVAGDGRFAGSTANPALAFLLREWVWPARPDWPLFVLIGLGGGIIGYCLSQAYRLGEAATIASYEYVALPLAIFWGWAIWGGAADDGRDLSDRGGGALRLPARAQAGRDRGCAAAAAPALRARDAARPGWTAQARRFFLQRATFRLTLRTGQPRTPLTPRGGFLRAARSGRL